MFHAPSKEAGCFTGNYRILATLALYSYKEPSARVKGRTLRRSRKELPQSATRPNMIVTKLIVPPSIRRYLAVNRGLYRSTAARDLLHGCLAAAAQIPVAANMHSGSRGKRPFPLGARRRMPSCATRAPVRLPDFYAMPGFIRIGEQLVQVLKLVFGIQVPQPPPCDQKFSGTGARRRVSRSASSRTK